jgi:hypothetical protein
VILFISPYPHFNNERDGMLQRIAAIDKILLNYSRFYVQVNWFAPILNRWRNENNTQITEFHPIYHRKKINELAQSAKLIYIHSIYQAETCLWLYKQYGHKIITDMHGLVPEETAMSGQRIRAIYYRTVERKIMAQSRFIVTVTESMSKHFVSTYGIHVQEKLICLPILSEHSRSKFNRRPLNVKPRMIYAGGLQVWQNIDFTLKFFRDQNILSKYDAIFLVNKPEKMLRKVEYFGLQDRLEVKSVPHHQVFEYYMQSEIGIIMRDESVVNSVALPTKLIEYLEYDLVPLVKHENIGDFLELGYQYLKPTDIQEGKISPARLNQMRLANQNALTKLHRQAVDGQSKLCETIEALADEQM